MAFVACYFERFCPPDCRRPGCSASHPPVNLAGSSDAETFHSFRGASPLRHQCRRSVGVPGGGRRDQPNVQEIRSKKRRQFKTAAFMVSCGAGSKDIFYDESIWSEECELRDWILYGKKTEESTDMKKGDINKSDTHSDHGVKSSD